MGQRRKAGTLPRLALVADGFTDRTVAGRTVKAVRGGVPWVHLRDHAASAKAFAEAARPLAARLRETAPGVLVSVNSRLDTAEALGAGLHTGWHGPSVKEARCQLGPGALVGCSAHGTGEVQSAAGTNRGADYLFFSPVFPTESKPGHPGAGTEALRRFCEAFSETPVFALGGVTPVRVRPCLDAGAHGVAVLSGILHADAPSRAASRYLQVLPDK